MCGKLQFGEVIWHFLEMHPEFGDFSAYINVITLQNDLEIAYMEEKFRFKRDHETIRVPFLGHKSEMMDLSFSDFFFSLKKGSHKVSLGSQEHRDSPRFAS